MGKKKKDKSNETNMLDNFSEFKDIETEKPYNTIGEWLDDEIEINICNLENKGIEIRDVYIYPALSITEHETECVQFLKVVYNKLK